MTAGVEVEATKEHPSPGPLATKINNAFFTRFRLKCRCTPVELREEGGLRCARCDAPVVRAA